LTCHVKIPQAWKMRIVYGFILFISLIIFGFLFQSFYHCNILTLYWQFRAIKMFFGSNLLWVILLLIHYLMVLWKKNSLFWKLLFHPSLPLHCVTVRKKKNKISNANIPHLECQKPTLTTIYNTIGDKTVILGCTKKFSISKSLELKFCHR
jgi:hypothetical protein